MLVYQYRYRWRIETAIRHLKQNFTGRCGADSPRVGALYLGAGQLFFNFWVALNCELPYQFDHTRVRATGIELLHGLHDADFEEMPDNMLEIQHLNSRLSLSRSTGCMSASGYEILTPSISLN